MKWMLMLYCIDISINEMKCLSTNIHTERDNAENNTLECNCYNQAGSDVYETK